MKIDWIWDEDGLRAHYRFVHQGRTVHMEKGRDTKRNASVGIDMYVEARDDEELPSCTDFDDIDIHNRLIVNPKPDLKGRWALTSIYEPDIKYTVDTKDALEVVLFFLEVGRITRKKANSAYIVVQFSQVFGAIPTIIEEMVCPRNKLKEAIDALLILNEGDPVYVFFAGDIEHTVQGMQYTKIGDFCYEVSSTNV